jgi:NADP-dependent aldehyde dehydrogenase
MSELAPILIEGEWRPADDVAGRFHAINPSTGEAIAGDFPNSGAKDVERAVAAACAVAPELVAIAPSTIADFLERYADGIEAAASELVELAHAETGLPREPRLAKVELPRTTGQLRQAAAAVRGYRWTQPVIDTQTGLRSHLAPLGKPVLVFGPNNFPFAFNGIAGSDFASAIAARNPVIAKAHPSHPHTCRKLAEIAHDALKASGLPAAAVQMLYRFDSRIGTGVAGDDRIGAIGFTGGRTGGLALKGAADKVGVLAFVELSSVNPVYLLAGALAERGEALAGEFFTSCTMGSGQFCTNPGIVIVPRGSEGDAFVAAAQAKFAAGTPGVLFSQGVRDGLVESVATLRKAGAECLAGGAIGEEPGFRFQPTLLSVDAKTFLADPTALQTEAFGPVSLLVRTDDVAQMVAVAGAFEGNLTATIYTAADDRDDAVWAQVAPVLRRRVGRLIANRMPTGVAVSPAQNHGGPFPSTGHPGFTAVGMPAAIRRFAALHSYDNVADRHLPVELRDRNPGGVPRLIDGSWTDADVGGA